MTKSFILQTFPIRITVAKKKTIKKCFKKFNIDSTGVEDNHNAMFVTVDGDDTNVYLVFNKNLTLTEVAHECTHATNHIINYLSDLLGIKELEGDEMQAYIMGFLTNKVWKILNKN